jgi:predicted nucleic acid-binding protein
MSWMLDTNVLVDLGTHDPKWRPWAERQFHAAQADGPVIINPILYAELATGFVTREDLDEWLRAPLFKRVPLPYEAAFSASRAFLAYRRGGGKKTAPLPDFYIGAHAERAGITLVTRDVARYRTYFPRLRLVTPED